MARDDRPGVLDAGRALEHRLHQIAQHARHRGNECQADPDPPRLAHAARGDVSHDEGSGHAAEEPLPRLLGREPLEEAVPSEGHAHEVGEDVVGPDDEDEEEHRPRIPRITPHEGDVGHERQRQGHVADAQQRHADIRRGVLAPAVELADEHQWQQQQQESHPGGQQRPEPARRTGTSRKEGEVDGKEHRARHHADQALRAVAPRLGQRVKFVHAADEQQQQQRAEAPRRPGDGPEDHRGKYDSAQRADREILHLVSHFQALRLVGCRSYRYASQHGRHVVYRSQHGGRAYHHTVRRLDGKLAYRAVWTEAAGASQ